MDLKIKKLSFLLGDTVPLPYYASTGAAAMDVAACLVQSVVIEPGEKVLIPTGFAIETPPGMVALIFGRSGLGIKSGVTLSNCVGVVDSDYRGEVKIGLINHGTEPFEICCGDRIAQIALMPVSNANLVITDELKETQRGADGFGSTGLKG